MYARGVTMREVQGFLLESYGVEVSASAAAARRCCCCTAQNIHAVCEDYRAAVGIDLVHDPADLQRRIDMPALVLWGEKSHVNRCFQPLQAWRERASDVRGTVLPCGHYPAEQASEETLAQILAFFG